MAVPRPSVFLGFAAGVGIGAGGAYFYFQHTKGMMRLESGQQTPTAVDATSAKLAKHPSLKHGAPLPVDVVRSFDSYVAAFDARTRNPRWVIERINRDTTNGDGDRQYSDFYEDKEIPAQFRPTLENYRGSGYDRGHMVPATNHKGSQRAMDATFSLSNISPQVGKGFNRDYWARFEKYVRDLTKTCSDVYVVTGPLWLPTRPSRTPSGATSFEYSYQAIGEPPGLVHVPTHFYKVVLAETEGKQAKVAIGAFVMPNKPIDPAAPLTSFAVPLERLESVAGLKFFPSYLDDRRKKAIDHAAEEWLKAGQQLLKMQKLKGSSGGDPLLPPPKDVEAASSSSSSVPAVAGASGAKGSGGGLTPAMRQVLFEPKTRGGAGVVHVCDHSVCDLPKPGWWLDNNNSKGVKRNSLGPEPASPHPRR